MPLLYPPRSTDSQAVARHRARLKRAVEAEPDATRRAHALAVLDDDRHRALIDGVLSGSPFLTEVALEAPFSLVRTLDEGAQAVVDQVFAELSEPGAPPERPRLMAALRRARKRLALAVGLADLADAWSLEQVTGTLTRFADLVIDCTLHRLLLDAADRREMQLDPDDPVGRSGLIVLGMGKYGAGELNYSSDIDLIVLYEPERFRVQGGATPMGLASRLVRGLEYVLQEKTKEGYVFRVDFRLRPHPPGHPLALPVEAAELYYERHGQNWERAAMIKARPVGGDLAAGERFLANLRPYLWRKYLDFAAIADIHSIKRQINAHRGFSEIAVHGHDVKVGRGGIREVEFFAQTQQLILGGRDPVLRNPRTVEALEALAESRWVEDEAAAEMIACYRYLRQVEHRLQMVADQQTQRLPEREDRFEAFAAFAGHDGAGTLVRDLDETFRTVERHYAALFETSPDLGAGASLVFTGTEDDPATLEHLAALGFSDPAAVSRRIRGWHHGHVRATRTVRARELLTELIPALLQAFGRTPDVNAAFALFDRFVSNLPSGVQIFSLLRANPKLLRLIVDLTGAAPKLASHLAAHTDLLDALLEPDFFEPLPEPGQLVAEMASRLQDARDLQDKLDMMRRWAHGRQFQAGLHILLGVTPAERACLMLSQIAEVAVVELLPEAEEWLVSQHGQIQGSRFCVVGLGKFGSRELTIGSDLDLIFVYDAPEEASSDGARPVSADVYFARLANRLTSALSARTGEGTLFEIDMRLRPSGNAGPVATRLTRFVRYQEEAAATWEHQALTRARVVAGEPGLAAEVEAAIEAVLRRPRPVDALAKDVRAMRMRIFKEHGNEDPWNLKHVRGGIVEIEFLAQFLQLAHLAAEPAIRDRSTPSVFARAASTGILPADEAVRLDEAWRLMIRLFATLRLSQEEKTMPKNAPQAMQEALLRATDPQGLAGVPNDIALLQLRLVESQEAVRQIFDRLVPTEGA
ncbi:bifunctional [glutamine synthetase] adenylyltransferase/[glutamine synthetase]-adenylyl-L-tyrosine phosphorylase [Geminicoccus roseus]|uniref:bifunctional [glutamine synthetase] adenylyltransferase/[glutamine synthetase]-adenylyl-L-tyrosine phosphorylase n=1 Tax=Geminicoccus roseus TaxID=404900 RepID=UPI0038991BC5